MISNVKIFLRKNVVLHTIYFKLKILFFKIQYFFLRKNNLKFKIMLLESNFSKAYSFFSNEILKKNEFSFSDFCEFLSLSLRLKNFKQRHDLNKIILDYNIWSPLFYIYLSYRDENKLLNKWLERVFKDDQVLISILKYPERFSNNEKIFSLKISKDKQKLSKLRFYLKDIISQMYFNDMQFNKMNNFFTLDHIISDCLMNKNLKKKKRLAIINLNPWTQSIGHFYYLDSFIKGVLLGILDYDYIIFSKEPKSIISNKYLYGLYKEFLDKKFILPKKKNYIISEPNMDSWRQKNKKFVLAHEVSKKIQEIWYKKKYSPIVKIPSEDILAGDKLISNFFKNKKWFCTIHVREPGFRLNDHLWLDSGRNAKIETYKKAIQYIDKNDGFTIRLGQKRINEFKFKGFFDYGSSSFKSDFLDIFLIYRAKFNIGTSSGLSFLPIVFGKYQNIFTNLNLLFFVSIPGSIGIPKLIFSIKNRKIENLRTYEKFDPPLLFYGNESFKNFGYKLIENSSEDILLLVQEFLNNFMKKNWNKILKKRKTFPLNSNKNIYTNNFIPLPKFFINKYKKIL